MFGNKCGRREDRAVRCCFEVAGLLIFPFPPSLGLLKEVTSLASIATASGCPAFPAGMSRCLGCCEQQWGKSELVCRIWVGRVHSPSPSPALKPFLQPLPPPEPLLQPEEQGGRGCVICADKCYHARSWEEGEDWALLIWGLLFSFSYPPQPQLPLGTVAVA